MKTLLTIISITILALNCCGQGEVYFGNRGVVVGGDHFVYADFVGGTKLEGTNFVAELYYGPRGADVSSLTPLAVSISAFRPPGSPDPGTWVGRLVSLPIGGYFNPITLDIRVWDFTQTQTYEDAVAAGGASGRYGHSGAFEYTQDYSFPAAPCDIEMVHQPAFALIPEPSTWLLFLLGLPAILFRKSLFR